MFMNQVMLLLDYNNVHNLYWGNAFSRYGLICLNIGDVPSFRFVWGCFVSLLPCLIVLNIIATCTFTRFDFWAHKPFVR